MRRSTVLTIVALAVAATCGMSAVTAAASAPLPLYLNEGDAFAILGHSCGGIQQQSYATGFAADGYPTGSVYLQTRCGGSGRGGGYKTTTYTGSASVVWTWFGETRSYGPMQGALEAHSSEDNDGDRLYNLGTVAYLEDGSPPLEPPAAPGEVSASVGLWEEGSSEALRMDVSWTEAAETAILIGSSTVTATPVDSSAPVLTATVASAPAHLQPVQPDTTYLVTVSSSDSEGTSQPSAPIEVHSPNEDGEVEHTHKNTETCEQNVGTIKLSPGLSETPHVQGVTVSGELKGCDGPLGFESATYADHLKISEEVTCAVLASGATEPLITPVSLSVRWTPNEVGTSRGALSMPISELAINGVSGTLEGGPFATPTTVSATSVYESFTGAPSCGATSGKKKAKPVKLGSFSTSIVEFG